jgi:hypothetical protein
MPKAVPGYCACLYQIGSTNILMIQPVYPKVSIIPRERGFYPGSEFYDNFYGFWAYISRASKFLSSFFSATQDTSPGAVVSKVVRSLNVII